MLSIATDGSTNVKALKDGALHVMALDYRSGIRPRAAVGRSEEQDRKKAKDRHST